MPRFKNTLNNRWFVAGLSLLAITLVARTLLSPDSGGAPATDHRAVVLAVPAAAEPAPAPAAPEPRGSVAEVAQRDPFAARAHVSLAPPVVDTAHLSALWTEHGETLALVNGRVLHPGEAIGRMTIESATQEGIWVTHARGRDFIVLGGTFVLTSPAALPAELALSP